MQNATYQNLNETMLSMAYPVMIINGHNDPAKRFESVTTVSPKGELKPRILPVGTKAYSDYKDWVMAAKGKGNKAIKFVTRKGNLIYAILP